MMGTILFTRLLAFMCVVLGLPASPDTTRNALPPPSPRFSPPAGARFTDDFHSGKLTQWRADKPGVWTVKRGMLKADLPDERQEHSMIYAGDSTWTDYAVDLDVCGMRGVDKGLILRVRGSRGLGIDLRGPGYHDLRVQMNELPIARVDVENGNGVWQHLRVELRGSRVRVLVNGTQVVDKRVPVKLATSGAIALAAYTGGVGQCTVYYDNVVVTGLGDGAAERTGE